MTLKYRIEIWNSNQNQEERHFFLPDQPNTYIFGFNPQLVSNETADRIVNMILLEAASRADDCSNPIDRDSQ